MKAPCGECHLQAGETCDICGAKQPMDDQRLRGGLPITDGVMIRAIQQLCGPTWLDGCITKTQSEFAKKGVFTWQMLDTNVLLDVVPAPEPYRGEWCYRLKTAHITPTGEVHVCEFYLPQSELPLSRQVH